jgi:hypothetical protein
MTLDTDHRKDDDFRGVAAADDMPATPAKLPGIGKSDYYSHVSSPAERTWKKLPHVGCRPIRKVHG